MSDDKPMRAFSTPSREVRGPQDLVARMNEASSEDWETVPFPARQQLGYHERLFDAKSGHGVNKYFGKSPQELVGAPEQIGEGDNTEVLSHIVGYHLEATEPPAEPAGAPGTAGYNQLVRNVGAADGYELDVEHTLTDGGGARVLQFAPDQALSPEEQAKVDGAGPFVPSPTLERSGADDGPMGTVNGVLHGHPETWETAPGGTKAAAAAADGPPPVSTEGDVVFVEQPADKATPPADKLEQKPEESPKAAEDNVGGADKPVARRGRPKKAADSDD